MNILHQLLTLMLFQTCKTIHLQNATETSKAQKGSQDIIKIVHVISVVQL